MKTQTKLLFFSSKLRQKISFNEDGELLTNQSKKTGNTSFPYPIYFKVGVSSWTVFYASVSISSTSILKAEHISSLYIGCTFGAGNKSLGRPFSLSVLQLMWGWLFFKSATCRNYCLHSNHGFIRPVGLKCGRRPTNLYQEIVTKHYEFAKRRFIKYIRSY